MLIKKLSDKAATIMAAYAIAVTFSIGLVMALAVAIGLSGMESHVTYAASGALSGPACNTAAALC